MAAHKRTHSRKRRTSFLRFPEVKGKVVETVEIDPAVRAIVILFQDKTALSLNLEPALTVIPQLSDRKTGNWRGIKRWPAVHSRQSMES
jgi:hypothetical protein